MKHKLSITLLLLSMFLLTQFIGLFMVNAYTPVTQEVFNPKTGEIEVIRLDEGLPFGLESEEDYNFLSIIFSFLIAFALIFFLMKYKWTIIIKIWFFLVVILALSISLNAILKLTTLQNASIIALAIAIPLATLKVFRPHFIIHNLTELFIYPGIAVVFIPILNPISIILLLILISLYDMWAVWKVGIMQKMAKFQMEEIKVFGGFLVPSIPQKVKKQIEKIKQKYKNKKIPEKIKSKKFKVNLAILGGGDIIFPIITSGVYLRYFGIIPALFILFGAFLGLTYLMLITKKDKAYPAMPYISAGIFLGIILSKLLVL